MITKDMTMTEILQKFPELEPVFYAIGMTCLHCAVAVTETLEEACAAHGYEISEVLDYLNKYTVSRA